MKYIVEHDGKNRHWRRSYKKKVGRDYGDMEIREKPLLREELLERIKNGTLEHSYCYGGGGGG